MLKIIKFFEVRGERKKYKVNYFLYFHTEGKIECKFAKYGNPNMRSLEMILSSAAIWYEVLILNFNIAYDEVVWQLMISIFGKDNFKLLHASIDFGIT